MPMALTPRRPYLQVDIGRTSPTDESTVGKAIATMPCPTTKHVRYGKVLGNLPSFLGSASL